jgi:single-stranded DNA-binding protein
MLLVLCTLTMSAANNGTIIGTIVSDIGQRTPNDSLTITEFRVAPVDAREEDSPIPFTAYNGIGDNIKKRYNKGDTVAIEYRLRYNTWQTPEGEPRGRMEVIATSSTTVRLGQISTAQRAAEAAMGSTESSVQRDAAPASAKTLVAAASSKKAEPTLDEVPF